MRLDGIDVGGDVIHVHVPSRNAAKHVDVDGIDNNASDNVIDVVLVNVMLMMGDITSDDNVGVSP